MNATIPFLQPQHLQQQLLSSSSSTNLSVPPSSPHIRNLSLPIAGLSGHSQALLPPLPLSVQHQHPTFEGQSTHQHHQQHQHLYQPSQQQHYHNHQPNRRNKHSSQYQQSFHPQSSLLQHASSNSKPLLGVSSINLSQNTGQHGSNTTMIPAAKKSATTVDEEANRYANVNIEDLAGQYYSMCKDQFGCRYLQKQIDEMPQKAISFLFQDIFDHVAELMTDPFGNYLCQKLLEFCDESQKEKIVARVAPSLVTICLNMHGTRAVQKLIENLTDAKHIRMITDSLATDAVKLIKDLNGNHVIQKCLSKLSPSMNQFVFDAVSATVVEVATHRHGCCVLQRCIDHAVETQKLQLVQEIAANGLALVQDPFGNYVVQYVLDLEDECYSSYIVRPFIGNVCLLSVQKFSSNVIEKCIRVSNSILRRHLIDELLDRAKLEALLRDSFANYVVQTALDYADAEQRQKLVECIKPILPAIRSTPYGKRIQTKLARSLAE